jgi:DNA-binding MarR family transcriptional regulator
MSQQAVAQALGIDRTTIVGLVDALEREGWVLRERNPSDRRAYAPKLSPKGRAVLRRAEKALDKVADSFFGGSPITSAPSSEGSS